MTHQFSRVPQARIPRSSFNRSHGLKTTVNSDRLYPILVDEVLPGDTVNCRAAMFGRMATPIKPLLDNLFMETFFFFVPTRLVWENWQKFNGEQDNPGDSTDYTIPVLSGASATAELSLRDYMGIPLGLVPNDTEVNALPFRCYALIFNEWFRDQNLQDSVPCPKDDGPDLVSDYGLEVRGKRHDYFTSCLPWPQKSQNPVTLPLGQSADVHAESTSSLDNYGVFDDFEGEQRMMLPVTDTSIIAGAVAGDAKLYADLSNATAATINDIRQAFQIQRLYERDARGGSRYTEILRSHFGVTSPDSRLQRPEFLGGGRSAVAINPVAQTSDQISGGPGAETPQGNLAAFGTVQAMGHGFTKSFVEHGYIIGLVNFRADLTYQQGLNRMWSRKTRFDFYWPALAHLGEQAVLSKEIYTDGTAADEDVFGYQEAFAEYRYKPSMITGLFRSTASEPLDYWHLSQHFGDRPLLNRDFIISNTPMDRVIAVPSEPEFLLDVYYQYRCVRPMPLYGVPGLVDHF